MLKKALILKLYSYNMHVGSFSSYNSKLNYYIFGKRYNFYIINLNKTFFLLKKVLFFLNNLAFTNGSLLFHYSNYMNLNIIFKCVLLSICKISNQQLITYNWVYGLIGNFFFSFYLLIKEITSLWLKRHNYLFNFNKKVNNYYSFDFENNKFENFEYLFLIKWKVKKKFKYQRKRFKWYSRWYKKWLRSTNTYKFWSFKTNSYKHTNFLKKICLNDINNIWKKKKLLNFKYLFLKLFYFIHFKKKDTFLYNLYSDKFYDIRYQYVYQKFQIYWRFVLYFKYFNNYYNVPDALFSIFPNHDSFPIKEYSSSGLVSIGLVDTDCDFNGINYSIISNDDSLMIVVFYFTLFSNLFLENKLNIYNIFSFKK